MFLRLIRLLRAVVATFHQEDSPRLLALGCAFGVLVGLVPKGNLTAAALALVLLSLRLNLVAAAASTALFSWLSAWTDPLAHRIGLAILSRESLQPYWAALYEKPPMPWTALNNTVVLGSVLLGLALWYPAYHLSRRLFSRYRDWAVAKIEQYRAAKMLAQADIVASWRL
jgi:uncharacterized protein (TIGR03546 family)